MCIQCAFTKHFNEFNIQKTIVKLMIINRYQ